MKHGFWGLFGTIALLSISCTQTEAVIESSSTPEASNLPVEQPEATPSPSPIVVSQTVGQQGTFVEVDHPTQGKARIVSENGNRYLELDSAFQTDGGPDLLVLLHRSRSPQSYDSGEYINLGRLQQTSGSQRYAIPATVNPAEFGSVVIWCRRFNVTFGYAPISAG